MSTPSVISPAEAQKIVEVIAKEYGWISRTAREQSHQEALDAIERLQIGLGAAARTLAQNLYRSNARFLFELIQNAEDNNYSRAKALGSEPYIKFTIRPNTIVIDCNEDGFTPANVKAICRIGESTKIRENAQYYIGEKGIGFKSVFMVASKVHIQSGPFSFFFEHEPGNNGMGMITPVWEHTDTTLEEPLTRITLTLLESLDLVDLLSQFDTFPHTLLLFLNKVGRIIVDEDVAGGHDIEDSTRVRAEKYLQENEDGQEVKSEQEDVDEQKDEDDQDGKDELDNEDDQGDGDELDNEGEEETAPENRVKSITTYSREFSPNINRAQVTLSVDQTKEPFSYSEAYWITRKTSFNLPTDGQRDYNTAEVILAFPVTDVDGQDWPYIESQEVYAYLPIRDFGFPFIIQSDFVTQASREDVMENARNKAILEGVAEAFVDAVLQFCQQPILQYRWTEYIPEDDKISSTFWSQLLNRIKERIKATPVLWSRSRSRLRLISEVKIVPTIFKDQYGQPLVADFPDEQEMYIDPEYANYYAHAKLRTLGLTTMHYRDCIKRIRRDANLPSFSKMKTADDDWHNRVASVLLPVFETPILKSHIPAVKTLPIIPLGDHRWTSMLDGAVYFPDTDGMPIPSDLGLRLVDSKASSNSTRKKLFAELGVVDVSAEKIRKLILEKHKKHWDKITLKSSVDHLHYLYWTRKNFPDPRLRVSARFCLFNEQNVSVDGDHDVYFQAEEKYGIQEFLRPALEEHLGSDAFGSFINNKYFILAPGIKEKYVTFFFEHWLKFYVQILRAPRLNDPKDPFKLSNICSYIIEKDPKNLLGTLRAHWSEYQYHINYELIKKLSEVVIPCTNIGQRELRRTFLPLKELEICCSEFLEPQLFPFLVLDGASTVEEWKFLEMFGVGAKNGVHFCLEILRRFKENRLSFSYKIYEEIQRKVWASTDSNSDIQCVQHTIFMEDLIYIPDCYERVGLRWTWASMCIWDGPHYMRVKYSLLPALSDANNATLTAFFVDTLQMKNVSCKNLTDELADIKKYVRNTANIHDIYIRLQTMATYLSAAELDAVRDSFEEGALVFDTLRQTWASTSSCLWSKDAQIPGKVTILGQYADLKDLFVGTLKVKIPDLGMLVDELSRIASSKLTVDDVKSLVWQINSFSPSHKALEKLKTLPIFPVRSGKLEPAVLRHRTEKFSINDRQPWADVFQGKLNFLDFKLEEVRKLQSFLSSLDLGNRYLSRSVTETSSFQGEVGEQSKQRTRQIRSRAHALARCAAHFSSPRIRDDILFIYHLLVGAEVYETDGIIKKLVHTQYFETVTVEIHRSKLHIAENSGILKIFVPKDRKSQELCYLQLLPTKLFNEVMMGNKTSNSTFASDSEAVRIIAALFMSSNEVVCDFLDDAGIIPVPYPDEFAIEASEQVASTIKPIIQHQDYSQANEETENFASSRDDRGQSPEESTSSPGSRLLSPTPSSSYRSNYRAATPTYRQPSLSTFSSQPSTPRSNEPLLFSVNSRQSEYRRLLNNVIAAAKSKRGGFPTRGAFNLDSLLNALAINSDTDPASYESPFGIRSENQLAHDMKIGAAGELYVFEILSRLQTHLPGFSQSNWQSTIRKYVNIHEDYHDLEPWKGAETADITYDDKEGEFTKLLVENQYLDDIWIGATPKYYLEVKTTTKECETRFFVSKSQYQRMERVRLREGQASPEVYIILRVFNLDKDTIDMRLYVDPKGIEERGDLVFTPESYSVLPAETTST